MKYSLRVTIAGLYLLVPDEDLKAVHILFPRHGPHAGDAPSQASHDGHAGEGEVATHPGAPPHDAQLAFEAKRDLRPILLNGYDLDLTGLTREPHMPTLPPEVFGLLDDTTAIACPRDIARSAAAGALFNARLSLRGGSFDVLASGEYELPDGKRVTLAGTIQWSIELPGRTFPAVALLSLGRGEPSSMPALEPMSDGLDSHTVRFGIVQSPEPFRVATLEQIWDPKATFSSDHMEMLYGVVPGVKKPVIPTPVRTSGATNAVLWPDRCVGGKTK